MLWVSLPSANTLKHTDQCPLCSTSIQILAWSWNGMESLAWIWQHHQNWLVTTVDYVVPPRKIPTANMESSPLAKVQCACLPSLESLAHWWDSSLPLSPFWIKLLVSIISQHRVRTPLRLDCHGLTTWTLETQIAVRSAVTQGCWVSHPARPSSVNRRSNAAIHFGITMDLSRYVSMFSSHPLPLDSISLLLPGHSLKFIQLRHYPISEHPESLKSGPDGKLDIQESSTYQHESVPYLQGSCSNSFQFLLWSWCYSDLSVGHKQIYSISKTWLHNNILAPFI